ncbi:Ribosomal protein L4/L1e [Sesbania bispinosa]|nr:Ribosomal protein L4/L1e [Sesbania bispinosa]
MAALLSKRLLRSSGSLRSLGRLCFDSPNAGFASSYKSHGPDEGAFPSDLLSKKPLATSERTIAGDIFDLPIRKDIIHRVVRWQLAKRQQGTHSTKTISEVSGTGRKPYKQKGLGRARHGTLRGPQFRGGATMHGPKPRSHAFKLNKKVRHLGLKIALSARAAEGKASLPTILSLSLPSPEKRKKKTSSLLYSVCCMNIHSCLYST